MIGKRYKIKYKGLTPLVWNRLTKELMDLIKSLKKDELEENEMKNWLMKAEVKNGNAIIPPDWIIGNLVNSAKETRIVPSFAVSKSQTFTKYISNIRINPTEPIVAGKAKDLKRKDAYMSSQGASKMGGKVLRCHPFLEEWGAEFELIDTIGRMKKDELRTLLDWGGQAVGLGDQRKSNFGRFFVEDLTEVKNA